MRAQLAFVLEGVITQQLMPRARGRGRVLVAEVMVCTPAIRAVIRDDKVHQIYGLMQAGQKYGMQTMNQALFNAVVSKDIAMEEAMRRSPDQIELSRCSASPWARGVRASNDAVEGSTTMATTFVWKGRSPNGEILSGEYQPENKDDLVTYLRKRKIIITSVREKAKRA